MLKDILNSLFQKDYGTGALIDDRLQAEKDKDIKFEEIVAKADNVFWQTKPEDKWRNFKEQNQNGSSSCVAQSVRKLLGISYFIKHGTYVDFSATDIYKRRSNFPRKGMIGVDALNIPTKGVTLNVLTQSDGLNEAQMNYVDIEQYKKDVGQVFKAGEPIVLPEDYIDTIASVIQKTKKGVMLFFYFTKAEWSKKVPTVNIENLNLRGAKILKHAVCAVDFTLYKGEKDLIIEDSAHFGRISQRIITAEFFDKRCYFAGYTMNFIFDGKEIVTPVSYKYTFTRPLEFGTRNDDIKALQNILKLQEMFPVNIESTGYYGWITSCAVLAFQRKYNVAPQAEIENLQGRRVGGKTMSTLNDFYSN